MDMKVSFRHPRLPEQLALDDHDQALIMLLQTGLSLSMSPYAELGRRLGMDEEEVISRIENLVDRNIIKRFGVVVRHHELGYRANAMVVWDIPDDRISDLGPCMGQFDFVTLCYRRPRRLPAWPYNLFTMIHGRDRDDVLDNVQFLAARCGLDDLQYDVLFSTRRFKQRGAIYRKVEKSD
jgi:DNA-binding Lrp family transcriptional regulator